MSTSPATCVRGHVLTDANTFVDSELVRRCRTCQRAAALASYHRRKQLKARAEATHCVRGHELAGDNLFIDARLQRVCRTCQRAAALASYHRRKQLNTEHVRPAARREVA
jgi:hypothetical protein